ncbi:MAG: seryl-tRNA synthetase [Actinomycetota bacterium]|nr:seryl-tRNA synthetase [Actinomycetota bacterium]
MIDIRRVRNDLEATKAAMARRHEPSLLADLDRLADLDVRARAAAIQRDELRADVNSASKEVAEAFKAGDPARAEEFKEVSRDLGETQRKIAAEAAALEEQVRDLLLRIPNVPSADAPEGITDADNVVVRIENFDADSYGEHQRVPHWEIGAALGILDLERGAKVSGSMFPFFRGAGATLSRALCQLALDRNADAFEEIRPPTLVRTDALVASGQLPKFAEDAYYIPSDDLWAIPTSEVPLTSLYRDEILDEADLPKRLMAYSPCLRREAGAAGRDTRGLLRVHEFDKVEILALTTPEQAPKMHEELIARAEARLVELGLAYRVIDICAGDLGQSHHRYFDLEVYAPGVDQWLEVSSISWFTDYQARRANIRYRPAGTTASGTELVHTLNGSALAVPRIWAAVVETHRQPDGSVKIPEALRPYFRGAEVIEASKSDRAPA